jgi:hypothetical protein|tara:strand:- start:4022 stop:4180 length:159 start_codon:yes stop_codon:yes gene_type:complete
MVWEMYPNDEPLRKKHLEDFVKVHARINKEEKTPANAYRLKVIEECIKRCSD